MNDSSCSVPMMVMNVFGKVVDESEEWKELKQKLQQWKQEKEEVNKQAWKVVELKDGDKVEILTTLCNLM